MEYSSNYAKKIRDAIEGKGKGYKINTYGCQMNAHDSEKIAGMLMQCGYIQDETDPSLILFNTCCVRDHAEAKVFGNVGALKEAKEQNPDLIIAICGCMMQQEGMAKKIKSRFPFVDIVFGTHNQELLPKMLYKRLAQNQRVYSITDGENIVEGVPVQRLNPYSAYVTIMYGCNNFCSYCIVPYVRGRERSRAASDIIKEATQLAQGGCKEITLLGQNVNSYSGQGGVNFPGLLRELDKIQGIEMIRFMTSHPKDLSHELIDVIANSNNICNHIHLPIQSGSNRILHEMNRCYTREHYMGLVEKLRRAIPNVAITTDIIVGFPGETEQDFKETLSLFEEVRFTAAFTFMYSVRTGTKAAAMPQIDKLTKKKRLWELNALQNRIIKEDCKGFIGETLKVLIDDLSAEEGEVRGKACNTKTVFVKGSKDLIGQVKEVKITEVRQGSLIGV